MKLPSHNAQIYTEASEWLVEFRAGDVGAQGRREFYEWLKTSPEHLRAYLELAAIWNEGSSLDADRTFDDVRLMQEVERESNISALAIPKPSQTAAATPSRTPLARSSVHNRPRIRLAVASAASILLMCACLGLWYLHSRDIYSTGVGEERTVRLNDGSTIELNSGSRVRVRFSTAERGVELLKGQALFHVAKDHQRAFVVRTDTVQVRAVGTQFDVYRNAGATTVTVVEGTVAVLPAGTGAAEIAATGDAARPFPGATIQSERSAPTLLLAAGEQVTLTPATPAKPIKADVAAATAWTQHELVFKAATLQSVIVEFNRYNKRQLTIRDAAIAELKVTGIFSSTDPSSLIRFLNARSDIAVSESGDEIVISAKP
jgi:transmembrane sensor